MLETVAFSGQMLVGAVIPRSGDARYLMLDIQDCTANEIQKHPVSSLPGRSSERAKTGNQYPGSIHNSNGFRLNSLSQMQYFMQLSG